MGRGLALVAFVFLGLFLDHSGSGSRVASESPEEATEGARFVAEVQEQGCWKEGAQKNCNLSKHPASASRVHASRDDESKAVDVPEVLGNNTHECVVLPFMSFMVADSASYSIALQVQEEEDRGEQAEAQERRRQRESRERALPYALLQSEERGQRARGCAMGADHAIDQNRCGNSRGTGGGPTFAPSARIATATRSTGDPSRGSCQGGRSEKDLGSCIQSGDRGKDLGVGSKSVGSAGQSRNYSWRLEQDLTGKEAIPQSQRGCCQNRQGLVAFCKDDPSSICARASCIQGAKGRSYQGAALKKDKLRELQDAVRRSALSQFGDQEEVPLAVAEDVYPLPQDELEEMVSDEELLAETEVKVSGSFIHAPQPFGRLAPSPTRKAEKQEGRQSKKPKNQNAVASGEPGS